MKKPKRKPKFRVGQVVCNDLGNYFRIGEVVPCFDNGNLVKFLYVERWTEWAEKRLRSLTTKEIGPRRKRG
jgi:hypothetical protein